MKSFRFESIWLLSRHEGRARAVSFHPNKNLILGRNHTGKSSLIRSLFETLGASPEGKLARWDENAISVVEFSVDDQHYRALHQRGYRALFDINGTMLVATGNHPVWSEYFATITGFNLVLTDKESESVLADPSCFFLPFYINQDGSWQIGWHTFRGMQRYHGPHTAILEYFSGIRPPEFYALRAERDQEQKALDDLRKELLFLERARERFGKSISLSGPKVQPHNFENEIARLTEEVTELNNRQEKLRDLAVREQELIESIQLQIDLATQALGVYDSDMKFLRKESSDRLICPTCGAEHNSFFDLLTYAEDARVLRQLVLQLHDDARKAKIKYHGTETKVRELNANYDRISQILDIRRDELRFGEVVESMGAEGAFKAFQDEQDQLKQEILSRIDRTESLADKLKTLTSKERKIEILTHFREYYVTALRALHLLPEDSSRAQINSRPAISGSGGPRAILAYYAALWRVCHGKHTAFSMPAVIDSPNQQSQDDINLPVVLKFIAQELPLDMQLIVGLEKQSDYEFDKTITLDEQYGLLQEDDYSAVEQMIDPLLKSMFDALSDHELENLT